MANTSDPLPPEEEREFQRDPDYATPELNTREQIEEFALKNDYALNSRFISLVIDAADRGDGLRLREMLDALHPADVADLLGFLSEDYREIVMPWIPPDALGEILPELDEEIREELVETLQPKDLAEVLQELDSDDATAVIEDMDEAQKQAVLAALPAEEREAITTALGFEEETAGRLMQREFVAAPSFWNVGQCIDHMRESGEDLPELFFDVYIIDPGHRPVGALPVSVLMRARRDMPLTSLMEPVTEIRVDQDQEDVAYIFEKYHLISAPVVDAGGRLIGQITVDDIVNIIQAENREDILALAGVSDEEGRDSSTWGVVRSRLPWLAINLLTAFASSLVISAFQDQIVALVTLAVLMPIVASIGGNSGTQALTVSVRALASRELTAANAIRTLWREVRVALFNGLVIGILLGLVAGALIYYTSPTDPMHEALKMGGVMLGAVLINFTAAALAGTLIPMSLSRVGRDPAVASPVFVTTVTDTIGFLSFLSLATMFLL